jgi:hypothetical protein
LLAIALSDQIRDIAMGGLRLSHPSLSEESLKVIYFKEMFGVRNKLFDFLSLIAKSALPMAPFGGRSIARIVRCGLKVASAAVGSLG